MTSHLHISVIDFLIIGAMSIIFDFMWRSLSAHWHNNSVGKAMAYIN